MSLRDVEAAYKNFFASLKGVRKGRKVGAPKFKSRKDARQSIRFTSNARWSITDSGRLNLPKIGTVEVKWSRPLPATPTSVTVIQDAAGRYFASFVIDTDPDTDATKQEAVDSLPKPVLRSSPGNEREGQNPRAPAQGASHQDDFRTPGRNPAWACSRRPTRDRPNARK